MGHCHKGRVQEVGLEPGDVPDHNVLPQVAWSSQKLFSSAYICALSREGTDYSGPLGAGAALTQGRGKVSPSIVGSCSSVAAALHFALDTAHDEPAHCSRTSENCVAWQFLSMQCYAHVFLILSLPTTCETHQASLDIPILKLGHTCLKPPREFNANVRFKSRKE